MCRFHLQNTLLQHKYRNEDNKFEIDRHYIFNQCAFVRQEEKENLISFQAEEHLKVFTEAHNYEHGL